MTLTLYYHPFSSYSWKALIPLYEAETPFTARRIDDSQFAAEWRRRWPIARFPVLVEEESGLTLPEASIIIEYLDRHYPGPQPMLPGDPDLRLEVRLLDRFFDNYLHASVQKIVGDRLRDSGRRDDRASKRRALCWTLATHGSRRAWRIVNGPQATLLRSPTAQRRRHSSMPTGCIRSATPFLVSPPIAPGASLDLPSSGPSTTHDRSAPFSRAAHPTEIEETRHIGLPDRY